MQSKRWITVVLLAALAACGKEEPKPQPAPTAAPAAQPVSAPAAGPADAGNASGASTTYTVKRGDTLARIGRAHGLGWRDLARWNGLENPGRLQVGQELRLAPPEPSSPR